jgi:hypothetical protein
MVKAEEKSKKEEKRKEEAIPGGTNPSPGRKDQVIDKMMQVMELLESKTKDLEDTLEAAEDKIIQPLINKPCEANNTIEEGKEEEKKEEVVEGPVGVGYSTGYDEPC